jgi:hypothetical protein
MQKRKKFDNVDKIKLSRIRNKFGRNPNYSIESIRYTKNGLPIWTVYVTRVGKKKTDNIRAKGGSGCSFFWIKFVILIAPTLALMWLYMYKKMNNTTFFF